MDSDCEFLPQTVSGRQRDEGGSGRMLAATVLADLQLTGSRKIRSSGVGRVARHYCIKINGSYPEPHASALDTYADDIDV